MTASVNRIKAPSGNPDADRFQAQCPACGWEGATYVNRYAEARTLAVRDAKNHRCKEEQT